MNSPDLQKRLDSFNQLTDNFPHEKASPVLVVHKIDEDLYEDLRLKAYLYLSKCVGSKRPILNDEEIVVAFEENYSSIQNITPNGMIVPKREMILEYNSLFASYSNIIKSLNITNKVSGFHYPFNIRVKQGIPDEENLKRHHPSEEVHSDTWTGANPEWVLTHIFLFGDIANNHIRYFEPPENFSSDWLLPVKHASDGRVFSSQFKQIDLDPKKGYLIVGDATAFHCSYRNPNAGTRISLDTGFDIKKIEANTGKDDSEFLGQVRDYRASEMMSVDDFFSVGKEVLLNFPQKLGEITDSRGGFKHPSGSELIPINKD